MSTYSSDFALHAATYYGEHEMDVASSPADMLVRVLAFDMRQDGDDTELYFTLQAAEEVAAAITRQIERLRMYDSLGVGPGHPRVEILGGMAGEMGAGFPIRTEDE